MYKFFFSFILVGMASVNCFAQKETATFGGGCFWCTEAIYKNLKGVESVISGYSGGKTKNPNYRDVCSGITGHAEVIQISFDPAIISFSEILEIFWATHDPTSLNQQGADFGTQYRSVIFYHTPQQKEIAEKYKEKLNQENAFNKPVITEITAFEKFYPAEKYHQDYYANNSSKGYCQITIAPKLQKLRNKFAEKLK